MRSSPSWAAGGCLYVDRGTAVPVPGFHVETVDTTAAGDSFNAGFAVALAEGMDIPAALRFANAVGALSTTGAGAQSSMPTRAQVEALLAPSLMVLARTTGMYGPGQAVPAGEARWNKKTRRVLL